MLELPGYPNESTLLARRLCFAFCGQAVSNLQAQSFKYGYAELTELIERLGIQYSSNN